MKWINFTKFLIVYRQSLIFRVNKTENTFFKEFLKLIIWFHELLLSYLLNSKQNTTKQNKENNFGACEKGNSSEASFPSQNGKNIHFTKHQMGFEKVGTFQGNLEQFTWSHIHSSLSLRFQLF